MNDIELNRELVLYIDKQFQAFKREAQQNYHNTYYDASLPQDIMKKHNVADEQKSRDIYAKAHQDWQAQQYQSTFIHDEGVIVFRGNDNF